MIRTLHFHIILYTGVEILVHYLLQSDDTDHFVQHLCSGLLQAHDIRTAESWSESQLSHNLHFLWSDVHIRYHTQYRHVSTPPTIHSNLGKLIHEGEINATEGSLIFQTSSIFHVSGRSLHSIWGGWSLSKLYHLTGSFLIHYFNQFWLVIQWMRNKSKRVLPRDDIATCNESPDKPDTRWGGLCQASQRKWWELSGLKWDPNKIWNSYNHIKYVGILRPLYV